MELVINLAGDYDVCTMPRLCREIEPAAEWAEAVVVDLTKVRFIDATCVNELIKLYEWRTAFAPAATSLIVPDEQTREMFLLLGFDERSVRSHRFGRTRHFERPA
jgi:anti-anti-sigma regulatory factor